VHSLRSTKLIMVITMGHTIELICTLKTLGTVARVHTMYQLSVEHQMSMLQVMAFLLD
jgi:hypothetical protein